jgi:hypothetical protein
MPSLKRAARLSIVLGLVVSLSGTSLCACVPGEWIAAKSCHLARTLRKCCCRGRAVQGCCGMACCQKQVPSRDEGSLPKSRVPSRHDLATKMVALAGLPDAQSVQGWDIGRFYAELRTRPALPTLRSQHVCIQI